jgi:hypothetical protein
VRISETRGEPAPPTLKVCINYQAGYRNGYTFALTGLDIEEKAALVERQLFAPFDGGRDHFDRAEVQLLRTDKADPGTNEEAVALLKITVKDRDPEKIGRRFANAAVEMALASIPGFFGVSGAPGPAQPFGAYWPALVPADLVPQHVVSLGGERTVIDNTSGDHAAPAIEAAGIPLPPAPAGPTRREPLGRIVGARSGDKGGNANVGLFCRSAEAFAWLDELLTVERFRELFGDLAELRVDRHRLANIWSLNFVIHGILDEGVAASSRQDAQAKGLGEYLRARHVDIPVSLLDD